TGWRLVTSIIRTVGNASDAATIRPSRLKTIAITTDWFVAIGGESGRSVRLSRNWIVPSAPPVTSSVPSGLNAAALTFSWPAGSGFAGGTKRPGGAYIGRS